MNNVWPTSLSEWVSTLVQLFGFLSVLLAAAWGVIKYPIEQRIKEMDDSQNERFKSLENQLLDKFRSGGERVGKVEAQADHLGGELVSIRQQAQAQEFKILEVTKDSGRIEGMLQRMEELLSRKAVDQNAMDIQIRERLVAIEARLSVFQDLSSVAREYMNRKE